MCIRDRSVRESVKKSFEKVEEETVTQPVAKKIIEEQPPVSKTKDSKRVKKGEDPAVSKAIEAVIKERLEQLANES